MVGMDDAEPRKLVDIMGKLPKGVIITVMVEARIPESKDSGSVKFDYGNILPNGTICEVLHINKHNHGYNADDTLAYVQDMENKRCYLIGLKGLEKID